MKKSILALTVIAIFAISVAPVFAGGVGTLKISPALPTASTSPADFSVYMDGNADATAYDPHIFLVMTQACYDGLAGDVVVTWSGVSSPLSIPKADFTEETVNSVQVPPDCYPGSDYTVASLKDHLNTTGPIYWAFEPFLDGPVTTTPTDFTVTIDSTHTEMLVYVLGKCDPDDTLFLNRVPPTIPGFVVPELATILLASASLSAFALYALKRKRATNAP